MPFPSHLGWEACEDELAKLVSDLLPDGLFEKDELTLNLYIQPFLMCGLAYVIKMKKRRIDVFCYSAGWPYSWNDNWRNSAEAIARDVSGMSPQYQRTLRQLQRWAKNEGGLVSSTSEDAPTATEGGLVSPTSEDAPTATEGLSFKGQEPAVKGGKLFLANPE